MTSASSRSGSFSAGAGMPFNAARLGLKPLTPMVRPAAASVASPTSVAHLPLAHPSPSVAHNRYGPPSHPPEESGPALSRRGSMSASAQPRSRRPSSVAGSVSQPQSPISISHRSLPSMTAGVRRRYSSATEDAAPLARRPSMVSGTLPLAGMRPTPKADVAETHRSLHARRQSSVAREPTRLHHSPSLNTLRSGRFSFVGGAQTVHETVFSDTSSLHPAIQQDRTGLPMALSPEEKISRVREDAELTAVAFKALLGHASLYEDQNDIQAEPRALSKLLASLFDMGAVKAELTNLSAPNRPATIDSAYMTVYYQQLIEQLVTIGHLVSAEPEFHNLLTFATKEMQSILTAPERAAAPAGLSAFAGYSSTPSQSLYGLFDVLRHRVASQPSYQAVLLKLVDTLAQFVLVSEDEKLRLYHTCKDLWAHGTDTPGAVPIEDKQGKPAKLEALRTMFSNAAATVEQLTGLPVMPFVRALAEWWSIADDVLPQLAKETHAFLSAKLPPQALSAPLYYVQHPLGHPYSEEESSVRFHILAERWTAVILADPHRSALLKVVKHADRLIQGVRGNSEFTRFSRDCKRLFSNFAGPDALGNTSYEISPEEIIEMLRVFSKRILTVPLEDIVLSDDSLDCSLMGIRVSSEDLVPETLSRTVDAEYALATSARHSVNVRQRTKLNLRSVKLVARGVEFAYRKKGAMPISDAGKADVQIKLNIQIVTSPGKSSTFTLPAFESSDVEIADCQIAFSGTGMDSLYKYAWPVLKPKITASLQKHLTTYVNQKLRAWLPAAVPAGLAKLGAAQGTHATARDLFRERVRSTSLRTDIPLDNVPSGPSSAVFEEGEAAPPTGLQQRRQSMADCLTSVSKRDSTLTDNIRRPPKAESSQLPAVFDDEETEYEYMAHSLSALARRDTTTFDAVANPPSAFPRSEGMTYEEYDQAALHEAAAEARPEGPTMSQALSELASRDGTTLEAIMSPHGSAAASVSAKKLQAVLDREQARSNSDSKPRHSMSKITRDLSGLPDLDPAPAPASQRSSGYYADAPQVSSPARSMADFLDARSRDDNTLPETQATGAYNTPHDRGVPRKSFSSLDDAERVKMKEMLSKLASTDTTLPENIASPPGSRSGSFAYARGARPSFTALKSSFAMSDALTEESTRDGTQIQQRQARAPSSSSVTGLSDAEMRQRRQSFKLSAEAMRDSTLLDNIAYPVTVNQSVTHDDNSGQPHPLARRASSVVSRRPKRLKSAWRGLRTVRLVLAWVDGRCRAKPPAGLRDSSISSGITRRHAFALAISEHATRFRPASGRLCQAIQRVYANGLPALARLVLYHEADEGQTTPLLVRLGSTLGDQLAFQLHNENLSDDADASLGQIATNTVQAAAVGGTFGALPGQTVNALFNAIGHISQFVLQPRQKTEVILVFKPDSSHAIAALPAHPALLAPGPASLPSSFASQRAGNSTGSVDNDMLSSVSLAGDSSKSSWPDEQAAHKASYLLGRLEGYLTIDAAALISDESTSTVEARDHQQMSIPVHASVCRSAFHIAGAPVEDNGMISFELGNCVAGETYVRDFELVNMSDIELYWSLEDPDGAMTGKNQDAWVVIVDAERGHWLGSKGNDWVKPYPAAPMSTRRLKLVFRPGVPQELDVTFQFANLQDSENFVQIHITASVALSRAPDSVLVRPEGPIDYGDCINGLWASRTITVKSLTEYPLDIAFSAEPGYEIKFQLADGSITASAGLPDSSAPIEDKARDTATDNYPGSDPSSHDFDAHPDSQSVTSRKSTLDSTSLFDASSELSSPRSTGVQRRAVDAPSSASRPPSRPPSRGSSIASERFSPQGPQAQRYEEKPPALNLPASKPRVLGGIALSQRFRTMTSENEARIDDICARPAVEYKIIVSYRPTASRDHKANPTLLRLTRRTFRIFIEFRRWTRRRSIDTAETYIGRFAIPCKARTCNSVIEVMPKAIDLGEAAVGLGKSATLTIRNLSEMAAKVDLRYVSKVISATKGEVEIAPLQSVELRVDAFPRRVNEKYRKQITVVNNLNKLNDQVVEVMARNVDKQRIAVHSLFYRILTSGGGNFLTFGNVVVNAMAVRTMALENPTDAPVLLELECAHREDIQLFVRAKRASEGPQGPSGSRRPSGDMTPLSSSAQAKDAVAASTKIRTAQIKDRVLDAFFSQPKAPTSSQASATSSHADSVTSSNAESSSSNDSTKPRPTEAYGQGVAFKNRHLLSQSEYLDLATGPPVDVKRVSPRSKKAIKLDKLETSGRLKLPTEGQDSEVIRPAFLPPLVPASPEKPRPASSRSSSHSGSPTRPPAMLSERSNTSPALTGRRRVRNIFLDASQKDNDELTLDEALLLSEKHSEHPSASSFKDHEAEDQYVRKYAKIKAALLSAISTGDLVPVHNVSIPPGGDEQLVVVLRPNSSTRPHVQGLYRKQDSRIFLKMVQYDEELMRTSPLAEGITCPEDIPVRELMLRTSMCRSILELGQAHINFSTIERGQTKTKVIVLKNRSETPLLYRIRKSGSIASGDIRIDSGRHGLIAPFSKKEVEFIFKPSMAGQFSELVTIENVEDSDNNQVLSIKAHIKRPATFAVEPSVLDFPSCQLGQISDGKKVTVTNLSKQSKTFVIALDPTGYCFASCTVDVNFEALGGDAKPALGKEDEEEIEHLSQKLKIAQRKGQDDKTTKYSKRLLELGVKIPKPEGESESDDPNSPASAATAELRQDASSISFSIPAQESRQIRLSLHPRARLPATSCSADAYEDVASLVTVQELKNADTITKIQITSRIIGNPCESRNDSPQPSQGRWISRPHARAVASRVIARRAKSTGRTAGSAGQARVMAETGRKRSGSIRETLDYIRDVPADHKLASFNGFADLPTSPASGAAPQPLAATVGHAKKDSKAASAIHDKDGKKLAGWEQGSQGLLHDLKTFRWMRHPQSSIKIIAAFVIGYFVSELVAPQSDNIFAHFLFISHKVPTSTLQKAATALTGRDSAPQYWKGEWDIAFLTFYIVVFSFVRQSLTEYVIGPIARSQGLTKDVKIARFMEQGYALAYFGVFSVFGLLVMKDMPIWWYDTKQFWLGLPHFEMSGPLKTYYLLQFSYWLQQMLVLLLGIEKPRSDFFELCIHHVVTLWLVFWSYMVSLTAIGVCVFVSMDVPDSWLATSKLLNYLPHTQRLSEYTFGIFLGIWTYFRHWQNLRMLWSVWFEYHDLVPASAVKWDPPTYWLLPWMRYQIFTPILLLQFVNLFWYFLMWRIVFRMFNGHAASDVREDEEDVTDSPQKTKKQQ
ncbi:uncharacterized protein L969DRAFT_92552 [Mixia osmundae IAM 14324]|uniref:uncharacterized protein n=1 Tax=Mixia osmundae (strain CBS 9802 / IAM 14324 / JCM 22182 / KY 12970) TaxID=764103 RepID=UPI0004A55591|nr:uncharacterized protein L969DRAFT_92552 [Mixia osmundae IAM 14324]KEI41322.1 hypothetical protein L969DRAFT_92552 [Mixia osmundae IAM 14324]